MPGGGSRGEERGKRRGGQEKRARRARRMGEEWMRKGEGEEDREARDRGTGRQGREKPPIGHDPSQHIQIAVETRHSRWKTRHCKMVN